MKGTGCCCTDETRKIGIQPNDKAVDTARFFDEVAVGIGGNDPLFKIVIDQIRYAQTRGLPGIHPKTSTN